METARFLISLTRTDNHQCRVEKQVRRADQSRAVLHAQLWLCKTQRLATYFGLSYNMYEIYKQNTEGKWVQVEKGDVSDAEMGRQRATPPGNKEAHKKVPAQGTARKTRAPKNGGQIDGLQPTRRQQLPRKTPVKPSPTSQSPLHRGLAEMREKARQYVADLKKNGELR